MGTAMLKEKVGAFCEIAGWSLGPLRKAERSARPWTIVAMLAMALASETRASPDPAPPSADAQHASAARNRGSIEAAKSDDSGAMRSGRGGDNGLVQLVQAASDTGQTSKREHNWAEALSCELTNARRDIELLQRLEQERHRAEFLAQDLAAARRDIEIQTALRDKAAEEAARLKQAAQGSAELPNSLQEARERAERLERELTAARREVEASILQATKAAEETSRLKAAGDGSAAELQQERERSARLEQDLEATRRVAETHAVLAANAAEEASRLKETREGGGAAELQSSLQRERERTAQLEQDLAAARRDTEAQVVLATKTREEALRAADAGAAELKGLRERAEALVQELSLSRSSIYAYEAQARTAGDAAAELRQAAASCTAAVGKVTPDERERFAALEQDLAAARRDIESQAARAAKAGEEFSRLKQESESGAAGLQSAMQKERERSARLEQDLAAVRRDVEIKTALVTKAGEEIDRLKAAEKGNAAELQKERERSVRLERDLAAAQRDVEARIVLVTKAGEETSRLTVAEKRCAADLLKERDLSAGLEKNLAEARLEVNSKTVLVTKTGEEMSRLAAAVKGGATDLQKEREQSARLERDLAAARRDAETQTARAVKASEAAFLQKRMAEAGAAESQQLCPTADAQAQSLALSRSAIHAYQAEARKAGTKAAVPGQRIENRVLSLGAAAEVVDRTGQKLVPAKGAAPDLETTGSTGRDKSIEIAAKPAAGGTQAAPVREVAQPSTEQAVEAAALVARASALLRQGDIGAARLVLERAVEMGSARASFALAETYDPLVLAKWGTYGTRGDARRAQDLYVRADAAGILEAKSRLDALRR